jgi:uncharacterized protein YcbX
MFFVSGLYIYPVKSLGGFSVAEAKVTPTGFEHDRRWMLVDRKGKFLTQRNFPPMALLQTAIIPEGLYISHKHFPEKNITIPFITSGHCSKKVQVWDDVCDAWCYDDPQMDAWFNEMLGTDCELVYMPDTTKRMVELPYAKNNEITSFSDGYPFLIIGQSSLDELNIKLEEPITIDRFRPNIFFTEANPFIEDTWKHFTINEVEFFGVKTCGRCVVTTIDQETAIAGKEPLKTLATYRTVDSKIKFGMNLLHKGDGIIKVGHKILVPGD